MAQKTFRKIQLQPQEAFWLDLMQLPHCIELEKEIILDAKLQLLFSPPYLGIDLEKIFQTTLEDGWLLPINGTRFAVKEKTIYVEVHDSVAEKLTILQKQKKELEREIIQLTNLICTQNSKRLHAQKIQKTENSIDLTNLDSNGNNICTPWDNQVSQRIYGGISPTLSPISSSPAKLIDINTLETYRNEKANELQQLQVSINQYKNSLNSCQINKVTFIFPLGCSVPNNYEQILKCLYGHHNYCQDNCPYKRDCVYLQTLANTNLGTSASADILQQQKTFLYKFWLQNYPHISDRAQKAKEWGIDIDHPEKLSNKTSYCYQIFNGNPNVNQGSIIFNTTKNQPFSTVNFGSKGTYKIANVISVVNNQFQELPIIPAKLLNLDKIAENRDAPICFTDSLELARVAPQDLIGPCIFTSYYGAQFDGFEIDFYPFRDRIVYYVIVEHSGLTREQMMDRVHANYLQMKAQVKNINLIFVELNGFRKEEDSWHFSMQRISEQNFCEHYFSSSAPDKAELSSVSLSRPAEESKSSTPPLLGPLIEAGRYILLVGDKHSGKTKFVIAVAAAVASGKELVQILRPEKLIKHDVLYLDFELGKKTFENNTKKILKSFFGDVTNHPFLHIEHLNGQGINIHLPDGIEKVRNIVEKYREKDLKLLIIDNITAVSGNAVADNSGWNQYTYPFITELTNAGITVIVIAHIDAGSLRGGKQKLYNGTECILLSKTSGNNIPKQYCITIERPYVISEYPYAEHHPMTIVINEENEYAEISFDKAYLKNILSNRSISANKLGYWFNVTPKTIREWQKKLT